MTEPDTKPVETPDAGMAALAENIQRLTASLADGKGRDHTRRFLDWGALATALAIALVTLMTYVTETNAKPSNDQVAEMIAKAVAPLKAQADAQASAVSSDIAEIKLDQEKAKAALVTLKNVQNLRYYQNLFQMKVGAYNANRKRGKPPEKSDELVAMEAGMAQ